MGLFGSMKSIFGEKTDYKQLIENGAIVIDVRTKEEFNNGHFKNSKNIPLDSLGGKVEKLKGKEVILVCRSGARAGRAKGILQSHGITAYNAGAWQNLN